jgi:hypothetical protein
MVEQFCDRHVRTVDFHDTTSDSSWGGYPLPNTMFPIYA